MKLVRSIWVGCAVVASLSSNSCGRVGYDSLAASGDESDAATSGEAIDAEPPTGQVLSQLASGWFHTCAIVAERAVCWGDGSAGQLGDGEQKVKGRPTPVLGLPGAPTRITAALEHSCAIVDGNAYCWGSDDSGQLGIGGAGGIHPPTLVQNLSSGSVSDISAGHFFTCAISNDRPFCWGNNSAGQLGIGNNMASDLALPVIGLPDAARAVAIDAGEDHACAVLDDGSAYCWGHDDDAGALGAGVGSTTSAVQVQTLTNISQITIAGWHACARQEGAAFCWGMGSNGELGNGENLGSATPVAVPSLASGVSDIACAGGPVDLDATCAIRDGELSCWGNNQFGRLGDGTTTASNIPLAVSGLPANALTVVGGMDHFCTLLENQSVWCWGRGREGQLGDNLLMDSLIPVQVDF